MTPFEKIFSQHVGPSTAKQLALADLLGDRGYRIDVRQGIAVFGEERPDPIVCSVQVLGSESAAGAWSATWLWAWANTMAELPNTVLSAADQLRDMGNRHQIPEFTHATHPSTIANGHELALLACGLFKRTAYYHLPFEGGTAFMLLLGLPDVVFEPVSAERALFVIQQVIQYHRCDHPTMVSAFLSSQGFNVDSVQGVPRQATRGAVTLDFEFDDNRQLIRM